TPRYERGATGLRKLDGPSTVAPIRARHPQWFVRSRLLDAEVVLVPHSDVLRVHRPEARLAQLRAGGASGRLEERVAGAAGALVALGVPAERIGVTGSLLVGAAGDSSDMDVVVYGRAAFARARAALATLLERGDWSGLGEAQWRDAWERRGAPGTLAEYVRHESRKHTKAVVEGSRLDLTLLQDAEEGEPERPPFRKLGRHSLQATVLDDRAAFDLPARYVVDDPDVPQLVAWTATYVGHARAGERVEAHGWLEEDAMGRRRLLVGTSREAPGESIRVLPDSQASLTV
ncbi:MAG TPA: hypothetical protein VFX50_11545, partial [Gemmatimonadales bacterium]|nr:hypothetical protein [Gemmatimonadales bacterium]